MNRSFISTISFYFDDDFIDESGLFQSRKNLHPYVDHRSELLSSTSLTRSVQPPVKPLTQRFRDDFIVKEFFNCWKEFAANRAHLAELRRKRVMIDFREFWFQDALSDPFYSYFEQPADFTKTHDTHHQMAYRLHKRLVRTGREQPKETMNGLVRSSFQPVLFDLPEFKLARQVSLHRRHQQIDYENETELVRLSDLVTRRDDVLPLVRERMKSIRRHRTPVNLRHDEVELKECLLKSSLLEHGTTKDLDRLIMDYYASIERHDANNSAARTLKLPAIKQASTRSRDTRRLTSSSLLDEINAKSS